MLKGVIHVVLSCLKINLFSVSKKKNAVEYVLSGATTATSGIVWADLLATRTAIAPLSLKTRIFLKSIADLLHLLRIMTISMTEKKEASQTKCYFDDGPNMCFVFEDGKIRARHICAACRCSFQCAGEKGFRGCKCFKVQLACECEECVKAEELTASRSFIYCSHSCYSTLENFTCTPEEPCGWCLRDLQLIE